MASPRGAVRWPELDGARALAVTMVSLFHVFAVFAPTHNPLKPSGGYLGVDVFYVISGFLITSLLLGERAGTGGVNLRNFYARRALRLFPALAVLLVVLAAVSLALPHETWSHPTLATVPWVVLYAGNWKGVLDGGTALGALGHTWSLAVEEQFYIVWPVLLGWFGRRLRSPRRAGWVIAGLAVAEMLYRYVALTHLGWGIDRVYYGSDTHSDGLLAGCALAFLLQSRGAAPFGLRAQRAIDAASVIGLVGLAALVMRESFFVSSEGLWFGISAGVVCSSAIVLGLVTTPVRWLGWVLRLRPLAWVGRRSYGIYLWVTATMFLASAVGPHGLDEYEYNAVVLAAAVGLAAVSYRAVELPFLRRKAGFRAKPSPPVVARPGAPAEA